MQTLNNMSQDDLKRIIKESIKETLSEKVLKEIFLEVLEDIAFGKAIEEGLNSDNVDTDTFMDNLKDKMHA